MQKQTLVRQRSGSKAVALDKRAELVKIRLLQLMAILLSAGFAWGLHLFIGR